MNELSSEFCLCFTRATRAKGIPKRAKRDRSQNRGVSAVRERPLEQLVVGLELFGISVFAIGSDVGARLGCMVGSAVGVGPPLCTASSSGDGSGSNPTVSLHSESKPYWSNPYTCKSAWSTSFFWRISRIRSGILSTPYVLIR